MSVTRSSRCKHLEKALSESTKRVQELEAANSLLEKKLVTLPLICTTNMSEATLSCISLALYSFTFVFATLGRMARALRGGRCCREVLPAATGRKQTLRKGEGRGGGAIKEPHPTAGGVAAKDPQGGGRKGRQKAERVQDAARCKSRRVTYKRPAAPN